DLRRGPVVREHHLRRRAARDRAAVGRGRLGGHYRCRGERRLPPPGPRDRHHGGGLPGGGAARRRPRLSPGGGDQHGGAGPLREPGLPLLAPVSLPRGPVLGPSWGAPVLAPVCAWRCAFSTDMPEYQVPRHAGSPGYFGGSGVLVTFGTMATSRSRGASGSRSGRTSTVGSDYYND